MICSSEVLSAAHLTSAPVSNAGGASGSSVGSFISPAVGNSGGRVGVSGGRAARCGAAPGGLETCACGKPEWIRI